jgi:hypothetical protein
VNSTEFVANFLLVRGEDENLGRGICLDEEANSDRWSVDDILYEPDAAENAEANEIRSFLTDCILSSCSRVSAKLSDFTAIDREIGSSQIFTNSEIALSSCSDEI